MLLVTHHVFLRGWEKQIAIDHKSALVGSKFLKYRKYLDLFYFFIRSSGKIYFFQ